MNKLTGTILKVAAAAVLVGAWTVVSAKGGQSLGKVEGKTLPAFSLKTTGGKTLSNKSLAGKVYLIDFWASWCGPCKKASPTLQELHKKYASKGVMVIGANVDEEDSAKIAKAYAKEHNYTYTFAVDAIPFAGKVGVGPIPAFMVVDKKGKVVKVIEGYYDKLGADLSKAIEGALKG